MNNTWHNSYEYLFEHSIRPGEQGVNFCSEVKIKHISVSQDARTSNQMSLKAALIGTGIFSRDAYFKLFVEQHEKVTLHHVWSRSQASAEEFRDR
jgi:hypothetical protein